MAAAAGTPTKLILSGARSEQGLTPGTDDHYALVISDGGTYKLRLRFSGEWSGVVSGTYATNTALGV